ncbi:MAG: SDR family NAD(P)-dependent oxidoreductase [Clostridia bacterium]|nr:SDR family NAD(P)-dependent oxidoreductase [Clostridia bacterium]
MNALITGVSGGMGGAAARLLSRSGYSVTGLDLKPPRDGAGIDFIEADLCRAEDISSAYERLAAQGKQFDCIINMAGIYDLDSLVEMGEEEFIRIFNVNLFAAYRVNKTFLPLLKPEGRIVITASELAPLDPLPFTGIYAITKSALSKYAYSLRMELQLLGYHVIELRPGAVDTGLLDVSTRRLDEFTGATELYAVNAEKFKSIVDRVEARKVSPEKVAKLLLRALSSKRPKFVYKINRNPLLLLLNALPDRIQTGIIKRILKTRT